MFTKNAYTSMARILANDVTGFTYKTMVGGTVSYSNFFAWMTNFSSALKTVSTIGNNNSTTASITIFGDGNTPPTVDDYQLSGSHFTTCSANVSISFDSDSNSFAALYTLTNTGTEEFVVREVGVFYYSGMVVREVLDSPVTIPAGGVGQVTLTIKVNIPSA